MGRIVRATVKWTGFVGSPGFTNLFFEPVVEGDPITQAIVDDAASKVSTWMGAIRAYLPTSVTLTLDPQVAEIDEQNGDIQAFWSLGASAPVTGTQAFSYSAASGYCISWSTGGVRNGRRVRGRTFVVPVSSSALAPDGSLDNTALGVFRSSATALANDGGGSRLVVWSRPTPGALIPDGGAYDITNVTVNDKVAILRSRRD
jgi:hypothetical protein